MHPVLREATVELGIDGQLPRLAEAAHESAQTLEKAGAWLKECVPVEEATYLDVVVHGSYARQEASDASDVDYLVVVHGLSDVRVTRRLLQAMDEFILEMMETGDRAEAERRRPGRTGLFGRIASAPDLTERIGLEQDTNVSHTRRLLVLEESVSIYRPELREKLMRAILDRYLADYTAAKTGVPRFLLNDVIRYWYTVAVDYQAKRWEANDTGWGLRYLKLLLSRKLSYAGTVVSLLLCDDRRPATTDNLIAQFEMPPLARLAQLALDDRFEEGDALRDALLIAEDFADFLVRRENRELAESVGSPQELKDNEALGEIRGLADRLHSALGTVLFGSLLGERSQRYLAL